MLKKKMQGGVFIDSSPSNKAASFDDDAKFKRKYHVLEQSLKDLVKGIEAKKKKLEEEKQRKLTLSAEVRFLKRKYDELIRNQSRKVRSVKPALARNQVQKIRKEAIAKPNQAPNLDLNEISIGEEEEEGRELQFTTEPHRVDNNYSSKKYSIGRSHDEQRSKDLKKSICRSNGSGSDRSGKRKISWQDQLVLGV